jgi:hypothetical protein
VDQGSAISNLIYDSTETRRGLKKNLGQDQEQCLKKPRVYIIDLVLSSSLPPLTEE